MRLWLAVIVWLMGAGVGAQQPSLRDVLARLDSYLQQYEETLASVVAEERYVQTLTTYDGPRNPDGTQMVAPGVMLPAAGRLTRVLLSDYALARSPGGHTWTGFRDTYEVDGKPVRDREARLVALLSTGSVDSSEQALRISRENARFNLGEPLLTRTINVPTLALDLIHPRNRSRLSVRRRGGAVVNGTGTWVLAYEERDRPTVVRTPEGRDRPVRGTVHVDPVTGEILQTVMAWDEPQGSITVDYGFDANVNALVPMTMNEEYRRPARFTITGRATYTNYRRFQTSGRLVQ